MNTVDFTTTKVAKEEKTNKYLINNIVPNIPTFTDLNRTLRNNIATRASLKNTLKLGSPASRDGKGLQPTEQFNNVLVGPNASGGGVLVVSGSSEKFKFNSISNPIGLPSNMNIYVSNVPKMGVTFPSSYLGEVFEFVTADNQVFSGTFTSGSVYF